MSVNRNGLERWYFFRSPENIRIDLLIEDLRDFCSVEVVEIAGEEGIWLLQNDENDLRVFLSGTVCCFNSVKDNRITKVLSKRHVFLTPVRFEECNWYDLLAELAFHSDLLKIEYATKNTKLLSQFQIEVNVSDFPSGLQSIPQLLKERLGIAKEFPINSVHIVRRNVTLRSSYIEHPDSSDSSRVLLEYLMRSSAS